MGDVIIDVGFTHGPSNSSLSQELKKVRDWYLPSLLLGHLDGLTLSIPGVRVGAIKLH